MNRPLRLASWALLAAAPAAYLACGGDDAYISPGAASLDGSAPQDAGPGSDATVADAGTDSGADGSIDASPPVLPDAGDAGDAADAAPTTGIVTITAISALTNQPEPGANIVFQDATGAVIATATTDTNGQASQTMLAGGQVTAVFGTAAVARLVTIQDVQPGDAVTALDALSFNEETTLVVTPPTTNPAPGPSTQLIVGFCQFNGLSVRFTPVDCGLASDVAEITVLSEAADGTPLASASTSATLATTGTTTVTFTGGWTTLPAPTVVTVNNISTAAVVDGGSGFEANVGHEDGTTAAQSPANDRISAASVDGGTVSLAFQPHVVGATFVQNEFDRYDELGTVLVTLASATRTAIGTTPPALDVSSPLPVITYAVTDAGLESDGGIAPSVSWTSAAPLTGTKGIIVQVYSGDSIWTIFAPPTATYVSLPTLPPALAAFAPAAPLHDPPTVIAIDGTFLANPAAVRAAAASLYPTFNLSSGIFFRTVVPDLPVDGTLKLTAYAQNSD